jgi:AcrR family transcriptional regulator
VGTGAREEQVRATRARIADAALELFLTQGYAQTTIDQIATAAGVGRRTVFRHYPTKEAMLFDQLRVRREVALTRLEERPASEHPLVSLHTVIRELCEQGYDRRLLGQIRAVLSTEPRLAGEQLWGGVRAFEADAVAILQRRPGACSAIELQVLTKTACNWLVTAAHVYLVEGRRSLVKTFDEVVSIALSGMRELEGTAFAGIR